MTIACAAPDTDLGIGLRLSTYLDCQARALGENGFQALAGGPVSAGLLSGLVTIFVALIGYRLILGATPMLRDGVSWAVRLGIVLALVTSWPAFQSLVYGVVVEGPGQVAATILPAAGLPSEALDSRVQQAYDTIRLGSAPDLDQASDALPQGGTASGQPPAPTPQLPQSPLAQPPLPQTASVFVISTLGTIAALRLAAGFLLAVAPLAILALLFDATLGVFSGWVRAVAGAALGVLAATVVTAIDLVMVESELARWQSAALNILGDSTDRQALTTIVLAFGLVMFVTVLVALRMAGAFRIAPFRSPWTMSAGERMRSVPSASGAGSAPAPARQLASTPADQPSRVSTVTDALTATVRREQARSTSAAAETPGRRSPGLRAGADDETAVGHAPLGAAGRRSIGRRSMSAARRDRTA